MIVMISTYLAYAQTLSKFLLFRSGPNFFENTILTVDLIFHVGRGGAPASLPAKALAPKVFAYAGG